MSEAVVLKIENVCINRMSEVILIIGVVPVVEGKVEYRGVVLKIENV